MVSESMQRHIEASHRRRRRVDARYQQAIKEAADMIAGIAIEGYDLNRADRAHQPYAAMSAEMDVVRDAAQSIAEHVRSRLTDRVHADMEGES